MWVKILAGVSIGLAVVGTLALLAVGFSNRPQQLPKQKVNPTGAITPPAASTPAEETPSTTPTPTPSPTPPLTVYCIGRTPCLSAAEIAIHSSKGNCWGWNKDVVINVSAFSSNYHLSKSGIDIEVASVCGKDLSAALAGHVDISGETRNHKPSTKNNQETSVVPYFIGYYDADKP